MAHDTFTLSPRLVPAPALLLLAQGMVPQPGKEGRKAPPCCSARYRCTQAGPMGPSQKSRCTQDEHKGSHTRPGTHLYTPSPWGCLPQRNSLVSKRNVQTGTLTQHADSTGSPLTLPQSPSTGRGAGAWCLSSALAPGSATCVHHTHQVLEVLQPRLLTRSQADTPDLDKQKRLKYMALLIFLKGQISQLPHFHDSLGNYTHGNFISFCFPCDSFYISPCTCMAAFGDIISAD